MRACSAVLALLVMGVGWPFGARGEIVEEETWYDSGGKVVKTVKRTYTGVEARRESDWEPAWVIRERRRDGGTRGRGVSWRTFRGAGWYYGPVYFGYVSRPYYRHGCGTRAVTPYRRGVGVRVGLWRPGRAIPHRHQGRTGH